MPLSPHWSSQHREEWALHVYRRLAVLISEKHDNTAKTEVWTTYPYSMMVIPNSVHTLGMNFLVYEVHTKKVWSSSKLVVIPLVWTSLCMKYILKSMINIPTSVHTIGMNNFLYQVHTYIQYMIVSPLASIGYLAIGRSNPAYTPPPSKACYSSLNEL